MKARNGWLAFVLLFFVISLARPVYAQDATLEASVEANPVMIIITPTPDAALVTPAVTDATPDTGAVNITVNQTGGETPTSTPTDETPVEPEPWFAKYLALVVVALGALRTLVSLGNTWLEGKKTDKSFVTGAELVGRFTPTAIKTMAVGFVKDSIRLGLNLQELLDEATDDVPYVVKVSLPPATPTAPTAAPPAYPRTPNQDA